MSLQAWQRTGILTRELRLYHELAPHLGRVSFLTYGHRPDLDIVKDLPQIDVLPNRRRLSANLYSVLAPWIHRRDLRRASVFRTNQLNGAWCAVIAKRLFRKPLVVRSGFLWSDFVSRQSGSALRLRVTRAIERIVLRSADRIILTSEADRDTAVSRYRLDAARVHVIPNYVDTATFAPRPVPRNKGQIVFVGRLDPQKNPLSLIEALEGLSGVRLLMIGDGPLRDAAKRRASGLPVQFLDRVDHQRLPDILTGAELFVLPSLYEGHPKALLEAMACGVPVVATRVPGIENLVVHRRTAFLTGTSPRELRDAIATLMVDHALRDSLSREARRFVEEQCSVRQAVAQELAVLSAL